MISASIRCDLGGIGMIDLHTHSILSDGELIPSELARRAQVKGYRIIGISDHADSSNLASIIASLLKVRDKMEYYRNITIIPGIEITHVPEEPHRRADPGGQKARRHVRGGPR